MIFSRMGVRSALARERSHQGVSARRSRHHGQANEDIRRTGGEMVRFDAALHDDSCKVWPALLADFGVGNGKDRATVEALRLSS